MFFVVGADVRVFGANINPSDMRTDFFYFRDDFEAELVKLAPAAEQESVHILIVDEVEHGGSDSFAKFVCYGYCSVSDKARYHFNSDTAV